MPNPLSLKQFFGRLRQIRRRLRRKRFGSVLILVVALLVLMALIGTAFISTARTDRYAAADNSYNTQIDLLVEGIVAVSQDAMLQDTIGPAPTDNIDNKVSRFGIVYRPDRWGDTSNAPGYHH